MRRIGASIFLFAVSLAGASPAAADSTPPPPPGGPAINQYVETLPSGDGWKAVGVGKNRSKPLPRKARAVLQEKTTPLAKKLRAIASSSTYGAPQKTLPRDDGTVNKAQGGPAKKGSREMSRPAESERSALSAAVSAAAGDQSRRPLILLAVIALLTVVTALVAATNKAR